MAHPSKHVDRFEISQVSLNDSVAVVQQIERSAGIHSMWRRRLAVVGTSFCPVFRTMTPRRAGVLAHPPRGMRVL
jgi:hypothetical protein